MVAGLLLGLAVTRLGATRTGELAVDISVADHRTGALTAVARFFDVAFSPGVALVLLLLLCGLIWRRSHFAATAIALLTIVGWLSVEVGKAVVQRPRPPAATVHALVSETAADSYPSGHTAFAAAAVIAIATTMTLVGRRATVAWAVGLSLVLLVAASRLYLGVHYLADVAGSVIFAGGSVLLGVALWARLLVGRSQHDGMLP
ncbi:phosphatase PAP2 family protein [Terrabacter sp. 2RAF25]|uniref:phosphatase PAP2 family protein n=1 Tax=Terrabacter sp. 2RAF25 TaxID=3232998 RepID=UPI003F9C7A7C